MSNSNPEQPDVDPPDGSPEVEPGSYPVPPPPFFESFNFTEEKGWDDRALNLIRGLVRPVITIGGAASMVWFAHEGLVDPKTLLAAFLPFAAWWFRDRVAR